jgi:NDP-sugar pyrophosphorylase family protein
MHREDARPISLCAVQVPDASRFGALELDEAGRCVRAFHEKNPLATGPAWINAGLYLMQREVIETIAADRPVSLEREVFPSYTDGRLGAFCQHKPFIDIGTPESFAAGASFFAQP